ncbi:MAG: hypothetical protein JWL71_429 [Acidobacteria bacterium]|nr:hypothetical protein [Acidobacteriota bacterium]
MADVTRSITEQTGNRMADYLASILVATREIPQRMAALFGAMQGMRIAAPALGTAAGAGANVINIRVTNKQVFNAQAGATTQALAQAGKAAGLELSTQMMDALNTALGQSYLRQRRIDGNPVATPR